MQKGSIRTNGRWWILKVREWVTVNGRKTRKDSYKKLALIQDHRPDPDGSAPAKVRALADLETAKVNTGQGQGRSADSLHSYIEKYLAAGLKRNGRPMDAGTLRGHHRDYKAIKDFIPDIQLRQFRTPDINKIFLSLIEQDGGEMRATSSYRNIRNFLSGVFRAAVGDGAVDFNPVRDAMVMTGNESDTHVYSLSEVKNLYEAVKDPSAHAAFMVLAFTGLRKGEVKGLRWEDYDDKSGVIQVRRSAEYGQIKEPKTKASKAPVPVVGIVKKALKAHLKLNSGDGYIFHAKDNSETLLNFEHLVTDVIVPGCSEMGIEWHGYHAFRRGLNAALTEAGVDKATRVDIMRHEHRDVTDRHYGKASLTQMRKALEKVEAAYLKVKKKGRR